MQTTALTNEDYAILGRNVRRGIRISDHHDSLDYRAMLAREESDRQFAGCYERPGQYVTRTASQS